MKRVIWLIIAALTAAILFYVSPVLVPAPVAARWAVRR